MLKNSFYIFGLVFIWACTNRQAETEQKLTDSLLRQHLRAVNQIPSYDTNTTDYQLIKAALLRDTVRLKALAYSDYNALKREQYYRETDSCLQQKGLKTDSTVEAYRFSFTMHLCYYKTVITARRKTHGFDVDLVVFQYAVDTTPCKILESRKTEIDSLTWQLFRDKLIYADFWGSKEENLVDNNGSGLLTVNGYTSGEAEVYKRSLGNSITRNIRGGETWMAALEVLLARIPPKEGCLRR
ncbi:MAG: hypothetical protein EOP48_26830 [Sphingobacteriales bacterium]|nr:MAG: hypothetical protein EOP48_26830 [Sphingobacteriales bacterium]